MKGHYWHSFKIQVVHEWFCRVGSGICEKSTDSQ